MSLAMAAAATSAVVVAWLRPQLPKLRLFQLPTAAITTTTDCRRLLPTSTRPPAAAHPTPQIPNAFAVTPPPKRPAPTPCAPAVPRGRVLQAVLARQQRDLAGRQAGQRHDVQQSNLATGDDVHLGGGV